MHLNATGTAAGASLGRSEAATRRPSLPQGQAPGVQAVTGCAVPSACVPGGPPAVFQGAVMEDPRAGWPACQAAQALNVVTASFHTLWGC